jgi:hypothetical protein
MPRGDGGSLVVEALVGIALLGVLAAGAQDLHAAATGSRLRSLERLVATWEARAEVEGMPHAWSGSASELSTVGAPARLVVTGPVEVSVFRHEETIDRGGASDPCAPPPSRASELALSVTGRRVVDDLPVATLMSRSRMTGLGGAVFVDTQQPTSSLVLSVVDHVGAAVPGASVTLTSVVSGSESLSSDLVTGPSGCSVAVGLRAGPHRVTVVLDGHVDRFHRPLGAMGPVAAIPGVPVRLAVVADRAAALSVTIAAEDGARLPDLVQGGLLTWAVAGDGVVPPSPSGATLDVHPGRVDVVVGVCADPRAMGTFSTFDLDAGAQLEAAVVLPSVTLGPFEAPPGGIRLLARRDTDCPGPGGIRPVLGWDLAVAPDATSIAPIISLPHGPWLVHVESMSGLHLAGPWPIVVGPSGDA